MAAPISEYTNVEIDAKVETLQSAINRNMNAISDVNIKANAKADIATVNAALETKADKTKLEDAEAMIDAYKYTKANTNDVNAALAGKADTETVNVKLATKAGTTLLEAAGAKIAILEAKLEASDARFDALDVSLAQQFEEMKTEMTRIENIRQRKATAAAAVAVIDAAAVETADGDAARAGPDGGSAPKTLVLPFDLTTTSQSKLTGTDRELVKAAILRALLAVTPTLFTAAELDEATLVQTGSIFQLQLAFKSGAVIDSTVTSGIITAIKSGSLNVPPVLTSNGGSTSVQITDPAIEATTDERGKGTDTDPQPSTGLSGSAVAGIVTPLLLIIGALVWVVLFGNQSRGGGGGGGGRVRRTAGLKDEYGDRYSTELERYMYARASRSYRMNQVHARSNPMSRG
jgi:hypothetical protein